MQLIKNYFPELPESKLEKLVLYGKLLRDWNLRINLVSRKDIDLFEVNHMLPVLAAAKHIQLAKNSSVLDIGTGGGIPGVVLAILFPDVEFFLVDSIEKKVAAVKDMCERLLLTNVVVKRMRVEDWKEKHTAVVGRAVTNLRDFVALAKPHIRKEKNSQCNGILYWTGGDLSEEVKNLKHKIFNLDEEFGGKFCQTKKMIYLPV